MSAERKPDLHLEIAHVLFIDVVGYSKLLADEQSETLQLLNQIVRGTTEFRTAEEKGELIRLPTGDGMALVYLTKPEAPVQCALQISKAIKSYPELQLRMGIHSGSVNQMRDVNDRSNVTGAGINIAQRVMDCGDAGHILLSRRVAEDLEQYRLWQPYLHDLGECEVKHGVRVHVFNLYTDEVGNRDVPAKLKPIAQEPAAAVVTSAGKSARSKHGLIAATVLLVIALALGFVFWVVSHRAAPKFEAKRLESEEKIQHPAESSPASTAAQTPHDSRPIYVVVAPASKGLNIRADPSAKSRIIEKLQQGDRVFLEDGNIRNDNPPYPVTWQKVTTMDGVTGWIDFDYVAPSKDANQSSTPAVAESPASAPAKEETEVRRLFEKWLSVSNAGDTEQEASFYAEPADYIGFGMLSRQELVQALQGDLQRWPKQHYTVSKGPLVEKLSGSEWRVTFAINFDVRDSSKGKRVTGTANLTWLIRRRESGELEIASSKEQVTSSTWHDIKRGGPPAQISPSQPTNAPSATPQPSSSIESATPEIRKAKPVLSASPKGS